MSRRRLFNPGITPVVYDVEGHTLDPQGRIVADDSDAVTASVIERGHVLDHGEEDSPPPLLPPEWAVPADEPESTSKRKAR